MTRSAPDACRTAPYAHRTTPGHAATGKHPTTGPSPRHVAVRNPMRPPPCAPYRTVVRYTIPPLGIPPFPFRHRTTVRYASPWGSLLRFGTVPHARADAVRRNRPPCHAARHREMAFIVMRHRPPPRYDVRRHATAPTITRRRSPLHGTVRHRAATSHTTSIITRQHPPLRHAIRHRTATAQGHAGHRANSAECATCPWIRSMRPAYDRLREPASGMTARHRRRDRLTRSASRRRRCRPCRPASAGTGPSSTCRS